MAYEEKKKMLFDCLLTAEKSIIGTSLEQKESVKGHLPQRTGPKVVSRRFQGRESIFKRPAAPIGKCLKPRRAPDYQVNPHKWKKYSLSDADISDRTNTSAALAFLKEIEKRKDSQDDPNDDEMDAHITFKRSAASKAPKFQRSIALRGAMESSQTEDDADTRPILKGSKLQMPEYVIGQKSSKNKKRRGTSSKAPTTDVSECRNTLKLQHLMEEEDDEGNDAE